MWGFDDAEYYKSVTKDLTSDLDRLRDANTQLRQAQQHSQKQHDADQTRLNAARAEIARLNEENRKLHAQKAALVEKLTCQRCGWELNPYTGSCGCSR